MRLPLRHEPYRQDAIEQRCAYLEQLIQAAIGLALGPAAEFVSTPKSRGRYGNALQWHLGLKSHDGLPELDWEDRIEIKLISVWRRKTGQIACDKVKICDFNVDPWRKISNVLWVFVDRVTRVVVGYRFWHLAGEARQMLEAAWAADPHFGEPLLFVEARETETKLAPAYYLAARWFNLAGILPASSTQLERASSYAAGIYPLDSQWWSQARRLNGQYRDPLVSLWRGSEYPSVPCPRCQGTLIFSHEEIQTTEWSPATHTMPLGARCALRSHILINSHMLPLACNHPGRAELEQALEDRIPPGAIWRLADRVMEPEDHLH